MKKKISKYLLGKVQEFAHKRINGSKALYEYRGESNISKMEEDIIIGTLGEYAVYQLLREQGLKCTKPDLKIYEKRKKSFDQDLIADRFKVHVKSQSLKSEKRYGRSFLFQRSDKLITKPDTNDFLAITNVDLDKREVNIIGFINVPAMVKLGLIGECSVPRFRTTKVAIYVDDIEPYGLVLDSLT